MTLLDGSVVIVTGAGRGIGRGEAIELAREGARVVVNELDPEVGQSVVDEITAAGGDAVLDTGDCSEESTAQGLVQRALDTWGRLDALVNNAGILRDRTVAKMSAA
jgi:NAD(P)-dependent dehydrogenase (short-subunit alcohol dehydrogenase family)